MSNVFLDTHFTVGLGDSERELQTPFLSASVAPPCEEVLCACNTDTFFVS